ncbi:T9SS type A sorting domain-containing protein [Lacinutrix sp. C3R15]|uniref:PA domain-containing protein n=1 Tax=Flavobacteriaceae TaxID=49546 RepID=UPI001C09659E|nr:MULTISPECIES: PA domain-containing protein [Flavobacteriaceae]MBU2938319.1 T9SS type A sorting domain-containing protein [Lacinutrix sp. C3R15]MDO6621633.1 T9SS type A sorting domain-containing protein [Oceanihabitans sp. 1_MG-2023]
MKKITNLLSVFFVFLLVGCNSNQESKKDVTHLKELHAKNLAKSPFTERLELSKKERKENRLTPNKYNEQMWELTMNPELGRPTPEKIAEIQKDLLEQRATTLAEGRVPGDALDNGWISRGPNNVGGRTRGVMFDPNDTSNNTVFAGGVSGGLWKNTDISNANTEWERVGIPENLSISVLTYDPNNTQIFYAGTGESYTGGDVSGDGLWQSTDGGTTWARIFGGMSGDSYFVSASNITANSPASVAGDYQSYPTTNFGPEITDVITADLVLANDTVGAEPTEACEEFGASATGKIALIRRGECAFVEKVKNAQDNGAIGVIMMNNVAGEPVPMGGTDDTITIPSVMISQADGDILEAAVASGTVNVSLNPTSGDFTALVVPGAQHINDVIVVDNNGVSDVYVAVGEGLYSASNAGTTIGGDAYGLYKSSDAGANWTELDMPLTADGHKHEPNDLDYDVDGDIFVATTRSALYGDGGGMVFSSEDAGTTFETRYTVTNGVRTQIVASKSSTRVYVLAELSNTGDNEYKVSVITSPVGFFPSFLDTVKTVPNDSEPSITVYDFTRGQAFYDLMIAIDPNNDNTIYVGGIDLFKSTNQGGTWSQLSHWYGGFGHQYVHADQHVAVFAPGDSNKMLFGNDGGVYYSEDAGATIEERNNGFITSQFYTVGVGPTTAFTGDYFAGGLQDNGTQLFQNANPTGTDSSTEPFGGDGAYTFFDQDGTDRYFIRNYVYNSGITLRHFNGDDDVNINNESASNGAFINPQALDSNLDILYSNYSATEVIIKRYSGIKSASTLTSTDLTDAVELTATPTAFTVSPYTTTSSKLLVGTVLGDVILVENANTASPTWTNLDDNVMVGSISDIEYGQSESEIFVTIHNYGVQNVWYSGDAGTTWEPKDGNLPDLPVKTILQNPLNLEEVIIGTELGVWYTTNFSDASPTWTQSYNGMSNVAVLDLDLRDDNMVFAASYGRGIFSGEFTPDSLSIDENTESTFSIFPNPSNGTINIKVAQDYGKVAASIFDMNGKQVYSSELSLNQQSTINANHLATGMYVLKIQGANFSHSEKLIIKK